MHDSMEQNASCSPWASHAHVVAAALQALASCIDAIRAAQKQQKKCGSRSGSSIGLGTCVSRTKRLYSHKLEHCGNMFELVVIDFGRCIMSLTVSAAASNQECAKWQHLVSCLYVHSNLACSECQLTAQPLLQKQLCMLCSHLHPAD